MKFQHILIIIILLFSNYTFSQTKEIDSLTFILENYQKEDTVKVNILNELSDAFYSTDIEKTLFFASKADSLSDNLNYKKGKAESLYLLGKYYYMKSFYPIALEYYQQLLEIYDDLNDEKSKATILNSIGIIHYLQSDYTQAYSYFEKSLEIQIKKNNKSGISGCYNNIGITFEEQGEHEKALEYYQKSLNIDAELEDTYGIAKSYTNIGNIFRKMGNNTEAISYLENAAKISEENNFKPDLSYIYFCIGSVYLNTNNFEKALNFTLKGKIIAKEYDLLDVLKDIYEQLSKIYAAKKDFENAYTNFTLHKELNDSLFNEENLKRIITLENTYEFEKEKHTIELEQQKKDAITAETIKRQKTIRNFLIAVVLLVIIFSLVILKNYFQKKKANIILEKQKIQIEEKNEELRQQKEEIISQANQLELTNKELEKLSIAASETDNAIVIMDKKGKFEWFNEGLSKLYGYSALELKEKFPDIFSISEKSNIKNIVKDVFEQKKTSNYESIIKTKSGQQMWVQTTLTPIIDENGEISKIIAIDSDINKLKKIEKELQIKNNHITASIQYAKRIQNAILPPKKNIDKNFENFIINRPKDIVSGDFYWYAETEKHHFFAIVDCTGHGVPGGFMSMIGNSLLNQIIFNIKLHETDKILTKLNELVVFSLHQDSFDNNHGMDICLCRIDKTKTSNSLQYTGAKRPILHFEKKLEKIRKIKPDRKSIGGVMQNNTIKFTAKSINFEENDIIFMYTDGITDQNNFERKKFGTCKLISTLEENIDKNIEIQKKELENKLDIWMKNTNQRDDICLLALKLGFVNLV